MIYCADYKKDKCPKLCVMGNATKQLMEGNNYDPNQVAINQITMTKFYGTEYCLLTHSQKPQLL